VTQNKGLYRAENNTAKSVIVSAYDVLPEQISGAPAWIDSDRFDIEARYERPEGLSGTEDGRQIRLRLQALLESRFQLKVHREPREWQAYVLVVAKKGAKLKPTERRTGGSSSHQNNGHWESQGFDMDGLARSLAFRVGRPVRNETGLEGRFDFTLDFEPDIPAAQFGDNSKPGAELKGPSLFTALQDQLGLKLEPRKVPVELLVVDRIERPSEN
jgi:uncharacterized protein (TIGR03435 family)